MSLFHAGLHPALDSNGDPIDGAIWKFYATGTTTPVNVYSDDSFGTSLGATVTADAAGRFVPIYVSDAAGVRAILTNASGTPIADFDIDPVNGDWIVPVTYSVATRTALKALSVTVNTDVVLREAGREGTFYLKTGSTPSDPLEGIYIASNTAGYYWQREWDGTNAMAEWFGATADDSGGTAKSANVAAIHAALALCPVVLLKGADYYTNATIKHNYDNVELRGAGSKWNSTYGARGTRLVLDNGTTQVLQVGPDSNPGGIAVMMQGPRATGIYCTRSVAPSIPTSAPGVLIQYVREAYLEDVASNESVNAFVLVGTVHPILYRCVALRETAGTGGTDAFKGFYMDGSSGIAAGGNASAYLSHCHADDNRASKVNSIGFYADVKFTDCFWSHCETVSCAVGMEVNGNDAASNDLGNTDMTIIHPVNDAFATYGIYIHNLGYSGSVSISEPYCGAASGATSAIQISSNAGGAVTISGGQLVMGASTATEGIVIDGSNGVSVLGTIILENGGNDGAVVLNVASNCRIMPTVLNKVVSGGPAVQLIGASTANYIAPVVLGKASGVTYGIQVTGTTDARNEYNCSGIDSACVNGGSGNKLVRNGVQITAAFTLTDTNTTSGVMT